MKITPFIISLLLICLYQVSPCYSNETTRLLDSLLMVYDHEISQSAQYINAHQQHIDSVRIHRTLNPFAQQIELGRLYHSFQSDSAIAYLSKACAAPETYSMQSHIHLAYLLAATGNYYEAKQVIEKVHHLPDTLLPIYYDAYQKIYTELSLYAKQQTKRQEASQMVTVYQDSLIHICHQLQITPACLYLAEIAQLRRQNNIPAVLQMCDSALKDLVPYSHDYAILAFETAITYRDTGAKTQYIQWLLESAIADVRSSVTDNGSSWMLAELMYENGDIERAYHYVTYSANNAAFFNARLRLEQVQPVALIIKEAYQQQLQKLTKRLLLLLMLTIVLLIIIIVGLILLKKKNGQLSDANRVKERYIYQYLEQNCEYITRLGKLARKAGEKDPDATIRRELTDFYQSFDATFLSLYPNFVEEINAKLQDGEPICPKDDHSLTTELRIIALIRLGVNSSAQIAKFLNCSPNTIYNNKAQLKKKGLLD